MPRLGSSGKLNKAISLPAARIGGKTVDAREEGCDGTERSFWGSLCGGRDLESRLKSERNDGHVVPNLTRKGNLFVEGVKEDRCDEDKDWWRAVDSSLLALSKWDADRKLRDWR